MFCNIASDTKFLVYYYLIASHDRSGFKLKVSKRIWVKELQGKEFTYPQKRESWTSVEKLYHIVSCGNEMLTNCLRFTNCLSLTESQIC